MAPHRKKKKKGTKKISVPKKASLVTLQSIKKRLRELHRQLSVLIAQQEGCRIEYKDLEKEVSGFYKNGLITINKNQSPNRQRFSIAHELGHHVLHGQTFFRTEHVSKGAIQKESERGSLQIEVEANRFASQLLMPKDRLEKDINSTSVTEEEIEELAQKYQVSAIALSNRLSTIGFSI